MPGTDLTPQGSSAPTAIDPLQVAEHFARCGWFKDASDPSKAVVKILAGQEMGIGPMAAMQGIHIIEGKPSLSANLLAAQVKRHPVYDYLVRKHEAEGCRIEFFQNGDSIGVSEFTSQDAVRAGVAGKQNYKRYPKAMLFARALSQGVRWYCPDVTAGSPAYVPEELGADEAPAPTDSTASEPPVGVINQDAAEYLFATARDAGLDGQRLSMWLTAASVDHAKIDSRSTAIAALGRLTPEQAEELSQWIAEAAQVHADAIAQAESGEWEPQS